MPLFREQTKFTVLGGAEQAIVGWHWSSADDLATAVAVIDGDIGVLWAGWRTVFHSSTTMVERTLFEYNAATGALVGSAPLDLPASPSGSLAGQPLPAQVAVGISLRTGTPGPKGRGRFYLPACSSSILASDGRVPLVTRETLVDEFAAYIGSVTATLAGGLSVVYSRTHHQAYPVTSVQGGDVWDTQRRRRNNLPESRYSVAV